MVLDLDAVRAWVERTCAAQGVPVFVADAAIVGRVGSLLGSGVPAVAPKGRAEDAGLSGSRRARSGSGRTSHPSSPPE
jgi:hypothetical protein